MQTNCAHNCLAVNMKVTPGLFIQTFIDKRAPEIGHKNLWNADPDVNEVIHGSIPAQLFLNVYDHTGAQQEQSQNLLIPPLTLWSPHIHCSVYRDSVGRLSQPLLLSVVWRHCGHRCWLWYALVRHTLPRPSCLIHQSVGHVEELFIKHNQCLLCGRERIQIRDGLKNGTR